MKPLKNLIMLIVPVLCNWLSLHAQDPQFSQFYNTSIYSNPATAGLSSDLKFTLAYRNQWMNVPGDLSSYLFSTDIQLRDKSVGLGALVMNNSEGSQNLRTRRIETIYTYRFSPFKNALVQFGTTIFSLNVRDINNDDLIFWDQIHPVYGPQDNSSSYVSSYNKPKYYPDWNVGLIYRQNYFFKRKTVVTPTLGFAVSHLFEPSISLLGDDIHLPRKFTIHGDFLTKLVFFNDLPFKRKIALLNPGFIYEQQSLFQTLTFGTKFDLYPFHSGIWFRNRTFISNIEGYNSIILLMGVIIPIRSNHNLIVDYTYDSTVSQLEFASGGTHEITLLYNISLPDKKGAIKCSVNEWWRVPSGLKFYDTKSKEN